MTEGNPIPKDVRRSDGPACATMLAAGIGSVVFGSVVVLAEASQAVKTWLNWWNPAGPRAGKSSVGVIAWLAAWIALHFWWRHRQISFRRVGIATLALVGVAFALTFPPVFATFGSH